MFCKHVFFFFFEDLKLFGEPNGLFMAIVAFLHVFGLCFRKHPGVTWSKTEQRWRAQCHMNGANLSFRVKPKDHSEAEREASFEKAVAWRKEQQKKEEEEMKEPPEKKRQKVEKEDKKRHKVEKEDDKKDEEHQELKQLQQQKRDAKACEEELGAKLKKMEATVSEGEAAQADLRQRPKRAEAKAAEAENPQASSRPIGIFEFAEQLRA